MASQTSSKLKAATITGLSYYLSITHLGFGQVKGLRPPGRPRSSFNDVALHDCQTRRITRPYRDAQDRLLWKDKTCPART